MSIVDFTRQIIFWSATKLTLKKTYKYITLIISKIERCNKYMSTKNNKLKRKKTILPFCSNYQSMNRIGRDFNSNIVINNINHIKQLIH